VATFSGARVLPMPSGYIAGEEGPSGDAYAISPNGQLIAGSDSDQDAVVWYKGKAIDLNSLLPAKSPWDFIKATGVNDNGQVVGDANDSSLPAGYSEVGFLIQLNLPK